MKQSMQSKGGVARTASLTPSRRREIATEAANKRWGKQVFIPTNEILKVAAGTPDKLLKINEVELECYVLENGLRVLSNTGMQRALGLSDRGGRIVGYVNKGTLKPFMQAEIIAAVENPIKFYRPASDKNNKVSIAHGIEATILKKVCDVILKARRENEAILSPLDKVVAQQAEILLGGFAEVGIVALVDEVTGYQKQKNEYQKILESYIEKELRPWLMTFEDNYYKQIYRLLGWDWDAFKGSGKNHPSYIGKLTNRLVYEKLPPGVLEALDQINRKNNKGNRPNRHHQYLTENIGYRHLIKHITAVTTIMEMYPDGEWVEALQRIDSRFPTHRLPQQLSLIN